MMLELAVKLQCDVKGEKEQENKGRTSVFAGGTYGFNKVAGRAC